MARVFGMERFRGCTREEVQMYLDQVRTEKKCLSCIYEGSYWNSCEGGEKCGNYQSDLNQLEKALKVMENEDN